MLMGLHHPEPLVDAARHLREDVGEGPKDATSLHGLGLLACEMNTSHLAAKFARLFRDVQIILIPDRDKVGEEGVDFSARVLRGVTASLRIAVLPAEFKETKS